MIHLCNICRHEFPTCHSGKIVFGIDRNPDARGEAADNVIECEGYEPYHQGRTMEEVNFSAMVVACCLVGMALILGAAALYQWVMQ